MISATIPNCISYDPTFGYEVAVIIQDGLRRMYAEQEDVYYYLTVMNENYQQPAMPEGAAPGILKGMYKLRDGRSPKGKSPRVQLMGSGVILREAIAAADLLKKDWGVDADIWSCPSFTELARDGNAVMRWNMLHPTEKPRVSHVEACLKDTQGPVIVTTDYMRALRRADPPARAQSLRRARHRRLRPLGHARKAAPLLRGQLLLHDGRRAEGAGRRRHDSGREGRRSDQEVRPRSGQAGAVDVDLTDSPYDSMRQR